VTWADRYLKNTLQLKFPNNGELAHDGAETMTTGVNTKYWNSVGELITVFPSPNYEQMANAEELVILWTDTSSHMFL
jgi:hypothetical protein